ARFSRRSMARQHSPTLLRLSHYGRPRHNLRCDLRAGRLDVVPAPPLSDPPDAVAAGVAGAVSLYRDDCAMDDRRAGAAAVAGLRPDADGGGRLTAGLSRKRTLHAAGIHGSGCGPGSSVFIFDLSRSAAGTGRRRGPPCGRPCGALTRKLMTTLWF